MRARELRRAPRRALEAFTSSCGGQLTMGRTLAEIRHELADARDEASLRRWLRRLAGDERAGARQAREQVRRRLARLRAERRRMDSLFALRARLRAGGVRFVAGVDEVGVGPLAGPVVAAAVVLPDEVSLPGLDDSKRIPPDARPALAREIRAQAVAWAVGEVSPAEIDRLNIYHAALEAMRRAVLGLGVVPDHLLVDARTVPRVAIPQTPLVKGDARDGSIAAASVVAKVHRDALMQRLDRELPGYGFARHMGYATPEHLAALERRGASPEHRRSFAPVAAARAPVAAARAPLAAARR